MYQTSLKREEYLEGTVPSIRNVLVGYGHWLEKLGIENEGTLEDYECYLNERDKQLEQQRQDEYVEFKHWIIKNRDDNCPYMIIKGDEWDRFQYSDDKDYEIDMELAEWNDFYDRFEELTGLNLLNSDRFVKLTYIGDNDIELVVNNIDGNNDRFIIGI